MIQLRNGDCLEVMKDIPYKSIDLVLTDPPYGLTANKWDSVIDFSKMWELLERVTRKGCPIVLFGNEPFSTYLRMSNISNYKYDIIWKKTTPTNFLNAKIQPLRIYENILVFGYGNIDYFPQKTKGHNRKVSRAVSKEKGKKTTNYNSYKNTTYDSTERYPLNVVEFKTDKQKQSFHPTQKPVNLLIYLIRQFSKEGAKVLDFTMGSGSTGVACEIEKRGFYGIEKDKNLFDIAKKRIEEQRKLITLF